MMLGNNSTTTDGLGNGSDGELGNGSDDAVREVWNGSAIEQGPDWLVDLYLSPPGWVNPSLKVLGVVALLVVAYRLYQWDGDVPLDRQRAMQQIAGTVVAITTATLAAVNLAAWPYVVDVAVGFTVGYGSVFAVFSIGPARWLPRLRNARERVVFGWVLLAVAAVLLPSLAMANGVGVALTKSRYMLAALAVGMALLNVRALQEHDDTGGAGV